MVTLNTIFNVFFLIFNFTVYLRQHISSAGRTVFDLNRGSAEVRFAGQEISEKSDPVQVQVAQKCL